MVTIAEDTTLLDKTKELCNTILDLPDYKAQMEKVEAFLANDEAKQQYVNVNERGQQLSQRHHAGEAISQEDGEAFEKMQQEMSGNEVIAGFLTAQESINAIHQTISKHVAKTLELGRLPEPEELAPDSGCCGGGGGESSGGG